MDEQEFQDLITLGHEQSGVEFKGPGARSDRPFFAQVALAVLGMSNHRDGGWVIIGVTEDKDKAPILAGLSDEQLSTWTYDDFAASIDEYADPNVTFHIEKVIADKKYFIIIKVHEFDDIPVLCKKAYMAEKIEFGKSVKVEALRKGACYVRPRRKPETTEIPTQADMRDLLELATEKKLRKFLSQAMDSGMIQQARTQPSDTDKFQEQINSFIG
jgi:predicted HTH transcriptional regulator